MGERRDHAMPKAFWSVVLEEVARIDVLEKRQWYDFDCMSSNGGGSWLDLVHWRMLAGRWLTGTGTTDSE